MCNANKLLTLEGLEPANFCLHDQRSTFIQMANPFAWPSDTKPGHVGYKVHWRRQSPLLVLIARQPLLHLLEMYECASARARACVCVWRE